MIAVLRKDCLRTIRLCPDLVRLEFYPRPVQELICQDGGEEDFGYRAGEGLVELSLYNRFDKSATVVRGGASCGTDVRTVGLVLAGCVAYFRAGELAILAQRRRFVSVERSDGICNRGIIVCR